MMPGSDFANGLAANGLVGSAPRFKEALAKAHRVALHDVPVLLSGETGTGKEVFARAVHYSSRRAGFPFVAVNCGAIPENLFENELFGHAKGAFTDARESFVGLIAQAEGGTLFLDEVEAMPLAGQVKLLRFLEDRTFRPLGAPAGLTADVRIVAATNESLPGRVRERTFREDLLYRLMVVAIDIPPLRDRAEDIGVLANHFLHRAMGVYRGPERWFSPEALDALRTHPWPGNLRELRNVVESSYLLSDHDEMTPADLSLSLPAEVAPARPRNAGSGIEALKTAKAKVVKEFEAAYLRGVLEAAKGNISHAARLAGKDRRALFALLKKHAIV